MKIIKMILWYLVAIPILFLIGIMLLAAFVSPLHPVYERSDASTFWNSAHAYTIKDTVYVAPTPDSITVTLSWEEWQAHQVYLAEDSMSGWWIKRAPRRSVSPGSGHGIMVPGTGEGSGASINMDSLSDQVWDEKLCPCHPLGATGSDTCGRAL